MRILVAGADYADSFADNVKTTLTEMGHEVVSPKPLNFTIHFSLPSVALRTLRDRFFGERPTPTDVELLKLARATRPDVILGVTTEIHPSVLHDLGAVCPGRCALWWGDAPANSRRWGLVDAGWHHIYLKDADAVRKLQLIGRNVRLLHEAMNPRWHRPVAQQRRDTVVVVGNFYAFRQAIALRLMEGGFSLELHGPKPPAWSATAIAKGWNGRYVAREEKSRVFGEGTACLNTFALAEGNSINCRAFEICGAAGLQLLEYRSSVEDCFEPGKELLTFRTFEELTDHLHRALRAPHETDMVRAAGLRRVLAEHTYRHRLERILSDLA